MKFALRLERRDGMTNMLPLARAMNPSPIAGDAGTAIPGCSVCPNGVVDLRDGTLRDGRPDDRDHDADGRRL